MHKLFSAAGGAIPVYGLTALLLGLDQLSKSLILASLAYGSSRPLLAPWLYLTHVHNIGAAFSIFEGQKLWLSGIALAVSIWIVVYERRLQQRHPLQLAALACILAGSLGNLTDRLRLGHVIDFLDLHGGGRNIWPIFNVADICINFGVGLLVLYFWRHPESRSDGPEPGPEHLSESKEERSLTPVSEASITES
ncbi:MAG: signal peptidase II [Candidatus Sericytochromatia bacterium]